jgi:hypothetical protein
MVLSAAAPETAPAVLEIGLLLVLAVTAGWLARRLGLPAVLGYLVVGLIVSPFTPGYVADRRQLQVLADVGVVLLLSRSESRSTRCGSCATERLCCGQLPCRCL